MEGFVQGLDHINHLADRSEGFVWRLQTAEGNSVSIRPYPDQRLLVTLSVWTSIEHLFAFTYTADHAAFLRQRARWFEHLEPHYLVLWWVPAGHIPSVREGQDRLEHLRRYGPTPWAFTFKERFPPPEPGELEDPVLAGRGG
ncbi:hypothetical protein BE04_34345 [Sorangium cellulosum]|uniref:DUF3291 domain-containing protein n=3 Tax=Sorangium cellulosum TaxID=56 RepID=A0A150Q1G8_SORCE|nr:hypothetical protein SCE1572_31210 [Sorangium cellulosum So0157-2]KYF61809.1 hypothetical protein BE04_34345 [Sorangium cellulosum]